MRKKKTLDEKVEFNCPFRVHANGTVTPDHTFLAPESVYDEKVEGPWELLTGYSGQDSYSGPIMHPSEYIGGGLERDILATPGVYVVLAAYSSPEEGEEEEEEMPDGWAVARRIE